MGRKVTLTSSHPSFLKWILSFYVKAASLFQEEGQYRYYQRWAGNLGSKILHKQTLLKQPLSSQFPLHHLPLLA